MTPIPHVHKRVERGQLNLQWNTFAMQRTGFVRAAGLRLPTKGVIIALVEESTLVLPRVAPRRHLSFHGPIHMFNQAHGKIRMQAFDECWLFRRDGTIEQMGGYPVPFQELCNGVAVRRDMIQVCVAFHLSCHGVRAWKYQSESGNTASTAQRLSVCHAKLGHSEPAIPTTAVHNAIAMAWVWQGQHRGGLKGTRMRVEVIPVAGPSGWQATETRPGPTCQLGPPNYYWAVLTWIGLWTRTYKSVVAPVTTRSFTSTVFNETLGSGDITSTCAFNAACVEQLCFEEKVSYETANTAEMGELHVAPSHTLCARRCCECCGHTTITLHVRTIFRLLQIKQQELCVEVFLCMTHDVQLRNVLDKRPVPG